MKAIIFDLDGVLVHTDDLHYQAWKKLSDEIKVPFDRSINNRLRGVSRMESLEIILEQSEHYFTTAEKVEMTERKNNYYKNLLTIMDPDDISAEVLKTLTELKARGHKLAVGSSSRNAGFIIDRTGIRDYFDAISDGNNITRSKPDPEVFLKAAEYLKEKAENCVVVEDAQAGIDAAKSAGMMAVAIGGAAGYERADYSILSFSELLKLEL